jgi:hypothetical protein
LPFACHLPRAGRTVLALSLALATACASQTVQISTLPSADERPHGDPARDAQLRLLTEAHRAYVQERYAAAVLFFRRFVESSPDSSRAAEARWWLGRANEQLGDYKAAMEQYRILASGQLVRQINGAVYEGHALRRLDELRQGAGGTKGSVKEIGIVVRGSDVPPTANIASWMQDLSAGGVTLVVVETVTESDLVKRMVSEAHTLDLHVWVAVNVHQPQGFELKSDWLSQSAVNNGPRSEAPDIAHPGYQAYLEEVVSKLSRTGCDGLFLPARSLSGFATEFSPASWREFSASFSLASSGNDSAQREAALVPTAEQAATYWRWVGWKGRSYAKLIARLRAALRMGNPRATVVTEIHRVTLETPLVGLEQYGEDVAEFLQRTSGAILVRREAGDDPLFEKLERQLGTSDRIWTGVTRPLSEAREPPRWNVLILPPSPPAVP